MTLIQKYRIQQFMEKGGTMEELHKAIGDPPFTIVVENVLDGLFLYKALMISKKTVRVNPNGLFLNMAINSK